MCRGEQVHCVAVAEAFGVGDVDAVTAIVFEGGADVPAVVAVGCPCTTLVGLDVCNHLDSGWGHWVSLEVVVAMEIFVGREAGVEATASEKIEGEFGLREE